jgi:hypothetical protein
VPSDPVKNALQPQDVPLDEGQKAELLQSVLQALGEAIEAHKEREAQLAKFLRARKCKPEFEKKNFPWPNASNVVVPIVAITVDTVAARLHRAVLGTKDIINAHLHTPARHQMDVPADPSDPMSQPLGPKPLEEKDVKDWAENFLLKGGAKDSLRTIFADMPLNGDAFVTANWVQEEKTYHAYNAAGEVVAQRVPQYEGTKWNVVSAADVLWPTGFDDWNALPWQAIRLHYSEADLYDFVDNGAFKLEDVQQLKPIERGDERYKVVKDASKQKPMPRQVYRLYELRGKFKIPQVQDTGRPVFEEVVLTVSHEHKLLMRAIYNPYFGKSRQFVKVPYLVQPHEITAEGAAEQSLPLHEEATTSHNQVIDAATAANAAITVVSNQTNVGPNEDVYPGKTIYTDGDANKGIAIFHLAEPSPALGAVEEKAFFMNEKRTGVSVYNMGMESPTIGSRATATGTVSLINEGNQRFWVSIDDMRRAIEELLYLSIQQEQQMRPEGHFFAKGRFIQFPQGDPRTTIGLSLALTSESVNKDIEIQQMQLLMAVVNEYYSRLNQAMMLITSPQFPPAAKMMAAVTMEASSKIVRRFVERFDIEDLDATVPTVMGALQQMSFLLQGQMGPGGGGAGPQGMGSPQQLGPGGPGAPAPGGSVPPPAGNGAGGRPAATSQAPGNMPVPE